MQTEISDMAMETLEQFVVLLYDRTSDMMNVNDFITVHNIIIIYYYTLSSTLLYLCLFY